MAELNEIEISKEDFIQWKQNKVTKEILGMVASMRDEARDEIGKGGTVSFGSVDATAIATSNITGYIRGLEELLNISFEDSTEEVEVFEGYS